MTPKEKAKELVNSFYQPLGYLKCSVCSDEMWEHAKQCALIAVDEILDLGYVPNEKSSFNVYKFYQEVKQQIESI